MDTPSGRRRPRTTTVPPSVEECLAGLQQEIGGPSRKHLREIALREGAARLAEIGRALPRLSRREQLLLALLVGAERTYQRPGDVFGRHLHLVRSSGEG